ncbi:MAG: ABC transporter permease [Gemmatimonadota bacterium]
MSLPIWKLEWRLAFRRRRLLYFNVAIPLLLILPIKLAGAPSFHASAAYAVLFVLFGTFGSAIPLLREGDGGPLRRMVLSGFPEWAFLAQRVVAGSLLDLLQLLPALLFILFPSNLNPGALLVAAASLALALLAANLIGVWVAAAAGSIAEGALFAAVIALFLLHGSGVFRTPAPGTVGATFDAILPASPMHETLLGAAGSGIPTGLIGTLPIPSALTLLLFVVTLLIAPFILARISAPPR